MPPIPQLLALRARVPDATLIDYRSVGGRYRIRRLGPADNTTTTGEH